MSASLLADAHVADPPVVLVVDDDLSLRTAVQRLLHAAGLRVRTVESVAGCLGALREAAPACCVLDLDLPDGSGLEVQRVLRHRQPVVPVVFVSGTADARTTAAAMRDGAVDFLCKPFDGHELVGAVARAVGRAEAARRDGARLAALRARHQRLTPREREVLALVVQGRLNKQIAVALGVTERTVKAHRACVMTKMDAGSVADLVRMADALAAADAS